MKLLTGTNANLHCFHARRHRLRQISNLERRNPADKGFAALCLLERLDHKLYALCQANPEPRHAVIRDWQLACAFVDQLLKQWNDRAAAARHIAVAHDRKIQVFRATVRIGSNKQFVRYQFRTAVKIYRIDCLVRRECDHLLDACVERRINDILRAVHIGLDRLVWIVLTRWHLFERRGVNHIIDALKRAFHALIIAHIADKEPQPVLVLRKVICHHPLLELIARVDNDLLRVVVCQHILCEASAKGACAACDQYRFII